MDETGTIQPFPQDPVSEPLTPFKQDLQVEIPPSNNKGGRPTTYDPKYCEEIIQFFDIEANYESEITVKYKNGDERTEYKQVANNLPTMAGFARKIGVHRETLLNWSKEYPEFFDSIKKVKEMQEDILISNGIQNLYAQPFAIFAAKNLINWRDKQEHELTGGTNEDGSRSAIRLSVNMGQGFVPASLTVLTSPATSTSTVTGAVQSPDMASESTKDLHSDNGNSETGTR